MKLWVDYTNHRGDRAWREIERIYSVAFHEYPPLGAKQRTTMCAVVKLADRKESRTLALTSCHAFVEADEMPSWQAVTSKDAANLHKDLKDAAATIERQAKKCSELRADLATAQQIIDRQAKSMAISAEEIGDLRTTCAQLSHEKAKLEEAAVGLGTIDMVLNELRDLRRITEADIAGDTAEAPDDVPDAVKASFPPGTKFKKLGDGMWMAEEPNDTCTCPDCVARREKAGEKAGTTSIEDMLKGWGEDEEAVPEVASEATPKDDCDCPACTVRRAAMAGVPFEEFAKANPGVFDKLVAQVAEKLGEIEVPDWFKAALTKIKAERKDDVRPGAAEPTSIDAMLRAAGFEGKPMGAEAKGRNPTYTGRFDDDAATVRRTMATLTKVLADKKPDDLSVYTVALPLWDAARVATIAGSLDFKALSLANARRQREWDKDGKLVGPLGTLYRSNELAGEAGEVANKIKKWVRELLSISGTRTDRGEIADELADVVICCDLLATDIEVDLGLAVRRKFNHTSSERDLKTRL